ncbi:MAG: GGDEF domain-containing protein [Thermodesulfobacteriota bacterium]
MIAVAVLLDAFVGLMDFLTGEEFSFSIFYLIPVVLVSTCVGWLEGILVSLLCAATWLMAEHASGRVYSHPLFLYWNTLVRLGFFLVVTLSLARMRSSWAALEDISRRDPLTGTLNSRAFKETARKEIERTSRHWHPYTLAYMDIDDFKAVNDSHGHAAGDELLVTVAETLADSIRNSDVLARVGGDEFVILFPETGVARARRAMHRVKDNVNQRMQEKRWPVTLSVGLVTFLTPAGSVDTMLKQADGLMYEAKRSGKNKVLCAAYADGKLSE